MVASVARSLKEMTVRKLRSELRVAKVHFCNSQILELRNVKFTAVVNIRRFPLRDIHAMIKLRSGWLFVHAHVPVGFMLN